MERYILAQKARALPFTTALPTTLGDKHQKRLSCDLKGLPYSLGQSSFKQWFSNLIPIPITGASLGKCHLPAAETHTFCLLRWGWWWLAEAAWVRETLGGSPACSGPLAPGHCGWPPSEKAARELLSLECYLTHHVSAGASSRLLTVQDCCPVFYKLETINARDSCEHVF